MQVEQRQHGGDLRAAPAPGEQDRAAEALPPAGLLVDAAVVHPRHFDDDGARRGLDGARLGVAVAYHEPVGTLVELGRELRDVVVDLDLERQGEHPLGTVAADLVDAEQGLRAATSPATTFNIGVPSFLAGASTPTPAIVELVNEEGTPRPRSGG